MLYVLILTLLAYLLEYKHLIKQQMSREILISVVLLIAGIILVSLELLHIHLPSPLIGLMTLIEPINLAIQTWMTS